MHYTDTTGRNDIVEAKVAMDRKGFVHFYVKTEADVTPAEGDDWMQLLIDADQAVSGNQLELTVPVGLLDGRTGFDFKWADHCGPLEDPMFLSGDAAPNRRFNYRFIWRR